MTVTEKVFHIGDVSQEMISEEIKFRQQVSFDLFNNQKETYQQIIEAEEEKPMADEGETTIFKESIEMDIQKLNIHEGETHREAITIELEKPHEVETTTFQETIEFDVQQPKVDEKETHKETIAIEFEKPQEIEGVTEIIEITTTEETPEFQTEQPKEETVEEKRSVIAVDFEKPQEVEEVLEEVELPVVKETVEVEVDQPTEETVEIVKETIVVEKEKPQEIEETEEEVETTSFQETIEFDIQQSKVEEIETHKETITIEFEKPQEIEGVTEIIEITTTEETAEVQPEQPKEESIEFIEEISEEFEMSAYQVLSDIDNVDNIQLTEKFDFIESTDEDFVLVPSLDYSVSGDIEKLELVETITSDNEKIDNRTEEQYVVVEDIPDDVKEFVMIDNKTEIIKEIFEEAEQTSEIISILEEIGEDLAKSETVTDTEITEKPISSVSVCKEADDDRAEPKFFTTLKNIKVTESSRVQLEVSFLGKPTPSVTWLIDDKIIKSTSEFQISSTETTSTLVIPEIFPEDEGIYKVVIENEVGQSESVGSVIVESESKGPEKPTEEVFTREDISEETHLDFEVEIKQEDIVTTEIISQTFEVQEELPEAPRFTQTLQKELLVFEGSNITLECFVVGKPSPVVTWYKEEVEITHSQRYISTFENGKCTLVINNITLDEEAEFICKATNEAGSTTTYVDIFVEKHGCPLRTLVREEYYRMEIELEIQWRRRNQAYDIVVKNSDKCLSFDENSNLKKHFESNTTKSVDVIKHNFSAIPDYVSKTYSHIHHDCLEAESNPVLSLNYDCLSVSENSHCKSDSSKADIAGPGFPKSTNQLIMHSLNRSSAKEKTALI